jgi:hypothetical protein
MRPKVAIHGNEAAAHVAYYASAAVSIVLLGCEL